MKKAVLIVCAALLPLAVFGNVWQASRFARLHDDVDSKARQQAEWLEKNKRLITGIAVLSSPDRIERIARNGLRLERVPAERSQTVEFSKRGDQDG